MAKTRLLVIVGCHGDESKKIPPCPFRISERTQGAGCADDYLCTAVKSEMRPGSHALIDGYVEWPSEMRKPGSFPNFCPLAANTRGFKPRGKVEPR